MVITEEMFEEWRGHPVTIRVMNMLEKEREEMKEGLIYDAYDNSEEVKGRCRVLAILLTLEYKDVV